MRIIINNDSDLSIIDAMRLVERVIKEGRISNYDKQYCYATVFAIDTNEYAVLSSLNKGSDSFRVINHKKRTP